METNIQEWCIQSPLSLRTDGPPLAAYWPSPFEKVTRDYSRRNGKEGSDLRIVS